MENTCILYHFKDRKHKSTTTWIHLCNTLCNKRLPLNYSIQCLPYWSCNSSTVTAIHCWLWYNAHSLTKSIDRFYYPGGKTEPWKYQLFKLAKLGVSVFAEWCWLWICTYWVPNHSLYREGHQNLFLMMHKFQEQGSFLPFLLTSG